MLRKITYPLPFYYTLLLCIIVAGFTYWVEKVSVEPGGDAAGNAATTLSVPDPGKYMVQRLSGYDYIKPLMFVEPNNKSARYAPMLQQIIAYIDNRKLSHDITGASFYFRDIENTEWTACNENEKYLPGSLMKVPVLISFLRMEEEEPGILNKEIFYGAPIDNERKPVFISKQLEPGKSYTVKELLKYMIAYSDNNATILLNRLLVFSKFAKTFVDIGLNAPVAGEANYPVSSRDYSLFIRAIYNASYITKAHSEYAAELLSTSVFKDGFIKGFPPGTKMIHKFGEAGTMQEHQFSESGIVYLGNNPYLLTVMTKGPDLAKLPAIISDIAGMVYQQMAGNN